MNFSNIPIKKAHCISNKIIVVIDDKLAKNLGIDEENTWFEQLQVEDGIMLKIKHFPTISNKECALST